MNLTRAHQIEFLCSSQNLVTLKVQERLTSICLNSDQKAFIEFSKYTLS